MTFIREENRSTSVFNDSVPKYWPRRDRCGSYIPLTFLFYILIQGTTEKGVGCLPDSGELETLLCGEGDFFVKRHKRSGRGVELNVKGVSYLTLGHGKHPAMLCQLRTYSLVEKSFNWRT